MFAIVGLGNPGAKYAATRHNVGFWLIESLEGVAGAQGRQVHWQEKLGCRFAKVELEGIEVFLVMPQKFMNRSGDALVPFLRYFGIGKEEIVVAHDDLDLSPGVLKVVGSGGAGGHRGVDSIINCLKDTEFYRIKVGIGHPRLSLQNEQSSGIFGFLFGISADIGAEVSTWVLSPPRPEEKELIKDALQKAARAAVLVFKDGLKETQRQFNRRNR